MLTNQDLDACPGLATAIREVSALRQHDRAILLRSDIDTARLLAARLAGDAPYHEVHCAMLGPGQGALLAEVQHLARTATAQPGTAVVFFSEAHRLDPEDRQRALSIARDRVVDPRGTRLAARLVFHADPRFGALDWPPGACFEVDVPGLAERPDDAVVLLPRFVARLLGREVRLDERAVDAVMAYPWAAIAELGAKAEHIQLGWPRERTSGVVYAGDLGIPFASATKRRAATQATPGRTLEAIMSEYEAEVIALVLARLDGNKSQAARELGISRSYLIQKCHKYGIQ